MLYERHFLRNNAPTTTCAQPKEKSDRSEPVAFFEEFLRLLIKEELER